MWADRWESWDLRDESWEMGELGQKKLIELKLELNCYGKKWSANLARVYCEDLEFWKRKRKIM